MNAKENYLRMLRGEIPEFMPSFFEPYMAPVKEELLTPQTAPNGPIITSFGVTYIGNAENNWGAMPDPRIHILEDITKWRGIIKAPDLSGRDWESYYKKKTENIDRENLCVMIDGGDFFLTLVSFMGFENALMAMHEEPEEVVELFEYVSQFYMAVLRNQMYYMRPEVYVLMDDDSAYQAPFFSVDMYRRLIKPFHRRQCDIALEFGAIVERHDCGKSEQFIDDWLDIGVREWNPAQISNDLKTVKSKYAGRLALSGCWDSQGPLSHKSVDDKVLKDALAEYTDTFAPGGGFTFGAMIGGPPDDPEAGAKRDVIKDFFFDYARDWYKTH
ncbi:MAG: veratrol--corrinoid protein metyltransferase [Oscillospiraceae bacterium]|nr:veratrol--corrinoid protein metyltransferase [Oscillospiraceae bacterium]